MTVTAGGGLVTITTSGLDRLGHIDADECLLRASFFGTDRTQLTGTIQIAVGFATGTREYELPATAFTAGQDQGDDTMIDARVTAPTTATAEPPPTTTAAPTTATTGPPPTAPIVRYSNCAEVRAAGAAPLYQDQPGYTTNLDRDGDGVACEP